MKEKYLSMLLVAALLMTISVKGEEDYAAMENGIVTEFKNYLSNLSTFVNDLAADLDNISKLPTSQYYYCFTGLDINLCGARYNKDISYTNINTIYSTIKNIPQAYALMLLPTLSRSTSMNIYSRLKLDAMGPCGRDECEFTKIMTDDQRKTAAGVPLTSSVVEFILYPQYGNSASYKGALRYIAYNSDKLTSIIKAGTFSTGISCGCHASKGSICIMTVTKSFTESSQTAPTTLLNQLTPQQCLASCTISNFKPLDADLKDRVRPKLVDQALTEEVVSFSIFENLNMFKIIPGIFLDKFGSSMFSTTSFVFTKDSPPMIYSKALSDALREKLLKDKCGSSTDLDITSRFTSISIKATVDVTFTTDFLTSSIQNTDFVNNLQACDSRFIGIACALDSSSSSTKCKISFASDLWIKSSYSVQTPVWTSSTTPNWSSTFCSNIYCKFGTAMSGCEDTSPSSTQCAAAITGCTSCQYDSSNVLSVCTKCSDTSALTSDNKCTICSNLDSSTGKCLQCSKGILYNGACVTSCPSGYDFDSATNSCIAGCPSYCAQCSIISSKNYCIKCNSMTCKLECPSTMPISHFISTTNFECSSACTSYGLLIPIKPDFFPLTTVTFPVCIDCQSKFCTSCTATSTMTYDLTKLTVCTKCGADVSGTALVLKDNTCVSSCGSSSYLNNGVCTACPTGTQVFSNPNLCENCGDKCVDGYCTSQSNLPLCTKCASGSFMQEGKCIAACTGDFKYFENSTITGVKNCLKACSTTNKFLKSTGECVSACPNTAYTDSTNSKCIDCPTGMQVYSNPSLCENCGDKCLNGYCITQNNLPMCTKCPEGSFMQEGKCIAACTGNYVVFTQTSVTGVKQCLKTCPSSLPNQLTSGECAKSCPENSALDSSKNCVVCNDKFPGCVSCVIGTDSSISTAVAVTSAVKVKCRKCNTATPYFNNDFTSCVATCSTGEVLIQGSGFGYCMKCPSECTSCSISNDKITCSACADGMYYDESKQTCSKNCPLLKYKYNGKCVTSCPSGFSAQLDTGKCVTCPIDGCVECVGVSSYFTCKKCASDRVKTGSLLAGYKCASSCDKTSSDYCMKDSQCMKVYGYKDSSGNCQDCPDNCSKCSLDTSGNVQCTQCNDKYCVDTSTNSCLLAASTNYVLMPYVNSATNALSMQCKATCDAGYVADSLSNCFKCDPAKFSQCTDTNCATWSQLLGIPYCKKCKDGYQADLLNKNICKKVNNCLIGQVIQNNDCVFCKDVISNCVECSNPSGTPKCSKCNIGYAVNAQYGCSLSTCASSILSSDGSSCVNQCSTSQYYLPTQNKCFDCTISNCKNCFYYNGNQLCIECGKDSSSTNVKLSVDLKSCLVLCPAPQIADSKGRCVSPPSNAATFVIAKEQDWNILNQLKKGLDAPCPHILNATSCNSGYNLLKKQDNTQYCGVCALNTVYDSASKSCVSCGNNCGECLSQTTCKTCVPNTYLVSGKCYWNCPRGMYVESGACTQCDSACGGLNGSCFAAGPNSCDGCQFDTSTNKFVTFLIQNANQCVSASNCPLSTFPADNGKCMPCDSGCTSCTGLGTQNCLDTKIASVDSTLCSLDHCSACSDLFHCSQCESTYQLSSDGTCNKVCDQGYYSDDNTNCKQCDSTCLTCVKAGECTQCKQTTSTSGYYGVLLVNGQCQYQQCPNNCRFCQVDNIKISPVCDTCLSGYKLNSSLNTCVSDPTAVAPTSCSPGQRLVDSCCIPCQNPFTTRCYTGSTASGVVEVSVACQKGYYLADGVCVPICKDGYFADQILGWCVKCACSCNTCTNYMDKCDNKCSVGTFSKSNDRCEYPLSSSPIITVDATKNTINVKFPANTSILHMIDTDISNESIYNTNNVCGDDAFNSDWSDFLTSSLNIGFIVSDLKSKLNSNEQRELDYLIAQDYSSISNSLISNNLLINYNMQYEGQFEIIKLIALYRWSMLGKTDIAIPFTYSVNNFYSDSSLIADTCSLLLDINSVLSLDNPICSFVTNSDKTLSVSIQVNDISKISPDANINFNNVLYYVSETTKLQIPSVTINIPTPNIQKGMVIVIDMKEEITKCEDLVISYQNSKGLGFNTTISIELDSIRDTASGSIIASYSTAYLKLINTYLTQLLIKSKTEKSMTIIVNKSYLKDLKGTETIYFSLKFNNQVTGEIQTIPKKVSIVSDAKIEVLDQALIISRTKITQINNVKYVSCSLSPTQAASKLTCKGLIYQQSSSSLSYTTKQIQFEKCTIDPTKINIDDIARIWVEVNLNGVLKIMEIAYKADKIQCSCDLSMIKSSFGTSESLSISSIQCPTSYALKWTFKKQSGTGSDKTFNTNSPSFKVSDWLTADTTYFMNIDITNPNMNVVYGTCAHLIDVQSASTTLNTQIRELNSGSLQGSLELEIITFDNNSQIFVESVSLTLTEQGSTTDLLKTTFSNAFKLVDQSKLTFNSGIWKSGTTYILSAVATLNGNTGKATKVITAVDNTLFDADFSPKIVSTGDTIKIIITNKSPSQCLFCAVGFFNDAFDPFEVISEPELLCGQDVYRETSIVVPALTNAIAKNTDLAVLCIGDDTDLSSQERISLKRLKILINSKALVSSDITPENDPITSEDLDRACLSILALPDNQCPASSFESICRQAIQNKENMISRDTGKFEKIWKQLTNKLVYSLTKVITCGDTPFDKSKHDLVKTILNGICKTFASDDSICLSPSNNIDVFTCVSFNAEFVNKILKIVNNIEAKIILSEDFSDLINLLDLVQNLIECASTDIITSNSGTEVHSTDSSTAILKVKKLDSTFKAIVKHSTSARMRRYLETSKNECSVSFDKIPQNLKTTENLIIKVQYNKQSSQYTSKDCNGLVSLTEAPPYCEIIIQNSAKDISGATTVKTIDVTSDQNGLSSLTVPLSTCSSSTKCAYYDQSKSCWSTDGVTTSENCSGCKSTHFSIFSFINSPSSSSSSNKNPASSAMSEAADNIVAIYQNILFYICVMLNFYLIFLFIKSCRNKNRKTHIISRRTDQINVKGYTKTLPAPKGEDDNEKMKQIKNMFEINGSRGSGSSSIPFEEAKIKENQKKSVGEIDAEQSYDAMGQENEVEAQIVKLESSFCSNYYSTFCRKHRIVSPIIFSHPTLSNFSRGLSVAFSIIQASLLMAIVIYGTSSTAVAIITIITGFILSRITCIFLERILNAKNQKYINWIQLGLVCLLLLEVVLVYIPTQMNVKSLTLLNASIVAFLILEFIVYELVSHIFQVSISRKLVRDPSKFNKMNKCAKLFLNLTVYEEINQLS